MKNAGSSHLLLLLSSSGAPLSSPTGLRPVCYSLFKPLLSCFFCIVDANHIMELEEHEVVADGVYVSNPPMDVPAMQKNIVDVKPSKSSNNEELHAIGEDIFLIMCTYKG